MRSLQVGAEHDGKWEGPQQRVPGAADPGLSQHSPGFSNVERAPGKGQPPVIPTRDLVGRASWGCMADGWPLGPLGPTEAPEKHADHCAGSSALVRPGEGRPRLCVTTMHTCMCTHTRGHAVTHTVTRVHTHPHAATCTHTCAHSHTCMWSHTCTHMCVCSHTCVHARAATHTHSCSPEHKLCHTEPHCRSRRAPACPVPAPAPARQEEPLHAMTPGRHASRVITEQDTRYLNHFLLPLLPTPLVCLRADLLPASDRMGVLVPRGTPSPHTVLSAPSADSQLFLLEEKYWKIGERIYTDFSLHPGFDFLVFLQLICVGEMQRNPLVFESRKDGTPVKCDR